MIVLPAIDIKDGQCVRLRQGIKEDKKIYSKNPVKVAKRFKKLGAQYLHLVDLDGAFEGEPKNIGIIEQIAKEVEIPFEIGGGIRTLETAKRYIDAGASRIILGTKAVEDLDFLDDLIQRYKGKIAVSLDAKNTIVCTNGWTESSHLEVMELANQLELMGLKTLIYTDISKDGMLTGPNFGMLNLLNQNLRLKIIASGGIANESHLDACEQMGLYGAITGKAIYEKKIDLGKYLRKQRENHAGKKNYSLS